MQIFGIKLSYSIITTPPLIIIITQPLITIITYTHTLLYIILNYLVVQLRLSQDYIAVMQDFLEYQEEIIDFLFLCVDVHKDKTSNSTNYNSNVPKSIVHKILLDNFEQRDRLKDMNLEVDKKGNTIAAKTIDKYKSIVKNMINVCLLFLYLSFSPCIYSICLFYIKYKL